MFNNSIDAFSEATKVLPGGVNSPVRAFKSVIGDPIFIERADGPYMYDIDGNKYIDYVQSWGPMIFGYGDKSINDFIIRNINNGISFGAPTELETRLAKDILSIFEHLDKIRFVNSGTEAVMTAIRLARGFTNRNDIVKFEGCYHGHSDSMLVKAGSGAATFGHPSSPGIPENLTKHTLLAKYNDIDSVKKCFEQSKDIACLIIEPIAGNMGLIPADIEFLLELKNICLENGALLIFDEVMSGFRASIKGATGVTGIESDIVTFGKVIGGGFPVGAVASSNEIMSKLSPDGEIYQAGTLSGNPIAMSAGIATISKIKNNLSMYDNMEQKAHRLLDGFKNISKQYNIKIQTNAKGSMFGFFFSDNEVKNFDDALKCDTKLFAKFHHEMLKNGIYLACSAYETGFISDVIKESMIDDTIIAIDKSLRNIKLMF
jgi:glutamate-1-semialdehyde 2,1-aminomutase